MTIRKIAILVTMALTGGIIGAIVYATKGSIPGIVWKNTDKGSIYAFVFIGVVAVSVITYIWLNDNDKADKK